MVDKYAVKTVLHMTGFIIMACHHRFIIMAGDPCQLPPVVAAPSAVTPPTSAAVGTVPTAMGTALTALGTVSAAVGTASATLGTVSAAVETASTILGTASATVGTDPAAFGSGETSPLPLPGPQAPLAKRPVTGVGALHGLTRPLLVRLIQMGHRAHLLRTQYRQATCDPSPPHTLASHCISSPVGSRRMA